MKSPPGEKCQRSWRGEAGPTTGESRAEIGVASWPSMGVGDIWGLWTGFSDYGACIEGLIEFQTEWTRGAVVMNTSFIQ